MKLQTAKDIPSSDHKHITALYQGVLAKWCRALRKTYAHSHDLNFDEKSETVPEELTIFVTEDGEARQLAFALNPELTDSWDDGSNVRRGKTAANASGQGQSTTSCEGNFKRQHSCGDVRHGSCQREEAKGKEFFDFNF